MNTRANVLAAALLTAMASPGWCATLTVTRVWPEKIAYRPGETAVIEVEVANATKAAATGELSLKLRYGLENEEPLAARPVTVPPSGKTVEKFSYPVPKDRKWGHEAVATVKSGGETSSTNEYFTVGGNPWELGHYITIFGLRGAKTAGTIDGSILPKFRKSYITTIEGYSWQPSVFDDMSPDVDTWRSGQGGYAEGKQDWQHLIERAHAMGMIVVTYIQSISYGTVGVEFMRRHPEWWTYSKEGRPPASFFFVDMLAKHQEDPDLNVADTPAGCSTGGFLPTEQVVGDYWIDEVIRSVEMFKWDGFRSDGNPFLTAGYDYTGAFHELKNPDDLQSEFIRKVRQRLTERYPDFKFGWNNVVGGYPQMFNGSKEEAVMLPGAYSLFEHFRSATEPNSVFHKWKQAVFYVQQETKAIRELGGFAHVGWMPSGRHLEAIMSACGTHVDTWSYLPEYRRFEFRWSEFVWDATQRYVRPGKEAVTVEAAGPVWWEDFVHARDLPGGGRRVVVHLLNWPAKDDDAWADKPQDPVKNVRVAFKLPDGRKLARLRVLSPDVAGDMVPVTAAADGSVTIPEVTLWTMVVAEY